MISKIYEQLIQFNNLKKSNNPKKKKKMDRRPKQTFPQKRLPDGQRTHTKKFIIAIVKLELPYDPAIPFLSIYPHKILIQKDVSTPMFTAALFTIVKTKKQPKYPAMNEWIKKMCYISTVKHYSTIKKK